MRLALFQPDIPGNLGAAIRLAACFGVGLDIIEPCGFPLTDKALRRAAMDYDELVLPVRHDSWAAFIGAATGRILLIETDGSTRLDRFAFEPGDHLVLGRESAGFPTDLRADIAHVLRIPMAPSARSLNVAIAGAIALHHGLFASGGLDGLT